MTHTLNTTEIAVLNACIEVMNAYGEGNYFCSDEVQVEGLTKHQIDGYFSQLKQKGYIDTLEEGYYFDMEVIKTEA